MHEIYKVFDENPSLDVKWGFLDLTKAFDRTWYNGLMCKLKYLGIYGNEYGFIHLFPSDRHERVVLNSQSSNWSLIKAVVSQGSILGSLLFLANITDVPEGLTTLPQLFMFLQHLQHLSVMAYWTFLNGLTNRRLYLTQMSRNRRKSCKHN